MSMPTRKLGDDDVSAIGFGAMGIGGVGFGPTNMTFNQRLAVLDRAFELGCTFWDTANVYGESEPLIGEWFKSNPKKRDKIFLATKFGYIHVGETFGFDLSAQAAKECCKKSLELLNVDRIDLFYAHRIADGKTPIEITVGAMAELVKEGKVRYLGLSECSAAAIRRAHAVHPITAVQVEYAPITLDIEDPKIGILATCRELGISVIPWSPLGKGILTGQYKSPDGFEPGDLRSVTPRFSKENFPKVLAVADKLKSIGHRHNATAGQISLAWILAQGPDFIPIPGTKSIKYLEENIGAAYITLSDKEVAEIREVCKESGAMDALRMAPEFMSAIYQDSPPLEGYKG
ncbi:Aldo/keto reductase [Calocera viscosa TUFC12733]|uniref:Aldo/keto reductase n=1 Tax=Calocera viscosa (strain TUFC12733) TaxID=1330018 RepID=A0A167HRY6_CALVF|nr:Aldo/keto reductase [Calocera viscosa TUFC12733]